MFPYWREHASKKQAQLRQKMLCHNDWVTVDRSGRSRGQRRVLTLLSRFFAGLSLCSNWRSIPTQNDRQTPKYTLFLFVSAKLRFVGYSELAGADPASWIGTCFASVLYQLIVTGTGWIQGPSTGRIALLLLHPVTPSPCQNHLHSRAIPLQNLPCRLVGCRHVAGQGQDTLMQRINDPLGLGEEAFL